ncbi:hypothetical protein [Methylobacterium nonmethylotrophicum]|uniref:Uncharacterized protein n=1 Tax=Methylobacterium nonmethylotrophicum TaxID=1141884 RepID=A0A4Z0NDH4_9HYPH|nr:hypothetical protein [Methylobacterium nonmethylotrophicum]TGD93737.1 hypothetical protein EU555_33160 [Methylobacterium nonmethylotrophicum]
MSDVVFEADRSNTTEFGIMPQTEEQRADTGELSLEELDEANGGLMIPILFFAGVGMAATYFALRGR